MGTNLTQIVLIGCIPCILLLFAIKTARQAFMISIVASWLIIPSVGFALHGLPDYTKWTAPTLACLMGIVLFDSGRLMKFRPHWYDLPVFFLCMGNIPTSLDNGLGLYDGISGALLKSFQWLFPYFFGRLYLNDLDGMRAYGRAMLIGGMAYILPCLWEIRVSPQLQYNFYGVNPGGWDLARFGLGFRPVVFMSTGIETSLWMAVCALVGYWLWFSGSIKTVFGVRFIWPLAVLFGTAVLCKSVGAIVALTRRADGQIQAKVHRECCSRSATRTRRGPGRTSPWR